MMLIPIPKTLFFSNFLSRGKRFVAVQILFPVILESLLDPTNNSIFLKFSTQRQAFCCSLGVVSSSLTITLRPQTLPTTIFFEKFLPSGKLFVALQMLSPVTLESISDPTNNSIFLKFSAQRQAFCCSLRALLKIYHMYAIGMYSNGHLKLQFI